jgi:hypothetical protein
MYFGSPGSLKAAVLGNAGNPSDACTLRSTAQVKMLARHAAAVATHAAMSTGRERRGAV